MPDTLPCASNPAAISGLACEYLAHGTPVWVSTAHRFGTDAMLLSHFCGLRRAERACDLGSGCGIIPLRWHDNGHRGPCLAVELQLEGAALLQKALETPCRLFSEDEPASSLTPAAHIRSLCGDLCTLQTEELFDVVSCNPPYFTGGFVSQKPGRGVARHQLCCTTAQVCRTAAQLLRDGGRLCLCQRPEMLGQTMADLVAAGFQPKRLRLVRQRPGSKPWLFLLDSRKAGGVGLQLLEDLIIEAPDGGFSEEVLQIYGKK